ncbi:RBR-type E3 ubiquitin transferase [Madurella fahalii]|uniref:RBR-type E3 ubiquitin transferase n=1 Tax=Madurella fahalii TaxID=1157608 RepID=A0ABQ0G4T5_9PEZI
MRLAKPFYGPINPAILGGFEWEDGEAGREQQSTSAPASSFIRYLPFNPALLGGFEENGKSPVSAAATERRSGTAGESGSDTTPAQAFQVPRRPQSPVIRPLVDDAEARGRQVVRQHLKRRSPRRNTVASPADSIRRNNPYAPAIDNRQDAMTLAFLQSQERVGHANLPAPPAVDDLGFGQRYQVAKETASVVITNQRKLPDILSGERECIICTDTKPVSEFPAAAITKTCDHAPTTCLVCIATSIRTDLNNRLWNEIKCPECRETLQYDDVQRFADAETKERYQTLSFRSAISQADNFLWCTSGCGYGQVHEGGMAQPIVICMLCNHRSCFHHKVAWHENLTCEEYDALQADPVNFRSRFDMENEEAEKAAAARRAQEDADRVFAQSLLAAEQRAVAEERERRERKKREEKEARERAEREERERKAQEARELAARRKAEEEASQKTVTTTTKPCPGCGAPIEKNQGW